MAALISDSVSRGDKSVDWLISKINEWYGIPWVQLIVVVLVLLISVVVTRKYSRPKINLSYQISTKRLIGYSSQELPEGFVVSFRGNEVERLYRTRVVLWNNGNSTIRGDDIVPHDSLRLSSRLQKYNLNIFDVKVIKVTRSVIKFEVRPDASRKSVNLNFDYLDSGDGAVVEILYDWYVGSEPSLGNPFASEPEALIQLVGSVRGLPRGATECGESFYSKKWRYRWELPRLFMPIIFASILIVLGSSYFQNFIFGASGSQADADVVTKFSFGLTVLFAIAVGIYGFLVHRRRYPKSLHIP